MTLQIRALIKSRQALYGLDNQKMAIKMLMTKSTWEKRLAHIDKLSLGEMSRLMEILHLTWSDLDQAA